MLSRGVVQTHPRNPLKLSRLDMKKPLESPPAVLTKWSGRRDSNSRRPPWQGGALPTELRPQSELQGVGATKVPSTAILETFPSRFFRARAGICAPGVACGRVAKPLRLVVLAQHEPVLFAPGGK